jgi:hypothetical protein
MMMQYPARGSARGGLVLLGLLIISHVASGATLCVRNDADSSISELYVSPVSCDTWGENVLEEEIAPGESVEIVIPSGSYDLKAVTLFSGVQVEWSVGICLEYNWNVTSEEPYIPVTGGG